MKEIISAVLFVVSLYAGTSALKTIHDEIKVAALTKASQGLPSLSNFARGLSANQSLKKKAHSNNRRKMKRINKMLDQKINGNEHLK